MLQPLATTYLADIVAICDGLDVLDRNSEQFTWELQNLETTVAKLADLGILFDSCGHYNDYRNTASELLDANTPARSSITKHIRLDSDNPHHQAIGHIIDTATLIDENRAVYADLLTAYQQAISTLLASLDADTVAKYYGQKMRSLIAACDTAAISQLLSEMADNPRCHEPGFKHAIEQHFNP